MGVQEVEQGQIIEVGGSINVWDAVKRKCLILYIINKKSKRMCVNGYIDV